MKLWALAVFLIIIAGVSAADYVRWNNMLDECVYFYDREDGRVQCFVPEEYCTTKTGNEEKRIDTDYCYYIPRSVQQCQQFTEGDLIIAKADVSDPDTGIGPAGKLITAFEKPFDEQGRWQTKEGDAGSYTTTISVTDGEYRAKTSICFTVSPINHAPKLAIEDVTASEGDVITLAPRCEDEGKVSIAYSGRMKAASWRTTYEDAGAYNVTVTCTDEEGLSADRTITVTVLDKNRPPHITAVATAATNK